MSGRSFGISALCLVVCVCAALPCSSQTVAWDGTWTNELGSVMTIEVIDGSVTGTYINNAAGTGCQGTPYPITGWALANLISFTVRWDNAHQNCNSITSWTGSYDSGTQEIIVPWTLVYLDASSDPQFQTGKDTFTQTSKTTSAFFPPAEQE